MGPGVGLILGVLGVLVAFKKYFRETLIVFAWFIVPLMAQSMYAKVFTVRYVLMTVPFFILLISMPLISKDTIIRKVFAFLIAIFIAQALLFDRTIAISPERANLPSSERSGYLEEWTAGTGIKDVSNYILNVYNTNPTKQIVVGTEGFFGTLPDGLQIYLNPYPKIIVIGTGLNFTDVPQQLKDSFKAHNETFLVVNSSRIKVKPEDYSKLGLKLLSSYPKAIRREHESKEYLQFGPQESLLFFQIVEPVIIKSR